MTEDLESSVNEKLNKEDHLTEIKHLKISLDHWNTMRVKYINRTHDLKSELNRVIDCYVKDSIKLHSAELSIDHYKQRLETEKTHYINKKLKDVNDGTRLKAESKKS